MTPVQLRAARKRLRMTQTAFAEVLGYKDLMSISNMERGKSPISQRTEYALRYLIAKRESKKS